jgi:hypothetical protein
MRRHAAPHDKKLQGALAEADARRVRHNFKLEALKSIANARDMWAPLAATRRSRWAASTSAATARALKQPTPPSIRATTIKRAGRRPLQTGRDLAQQIESSAPWVAR